MATRQVSETVARLVEPIARDHGLELVDVEFQPQGRRSVLRLYIDRAGGVSLDDLAGVSREVSDLLDAHDAVPGAYTLECSSPGINRRLRYPEDFARYEGKVVRVRTALPVDGARNFLGVLSATTESGIEIEDQAKGRIEIPFHAIDRAHYEHDFALELRSGRT